MAIRALKSMQESRRDLQHEGSPVQELGSIFQRIAAHGEPGRAWLQEILVIARKQLATLDAAARAEAHGEDH